MSDNMRQLQNKCKNQDLIYVQWYPYKMRSGYYIANPSEEALEKFYENIRAADPKHESFVLILWKTGTYLNLNMMLIDEYIKTCGCLKFFADTMASVPQFDTVSVEVLDKIRAEILDCLKALDEIEKSGLNIYLPNEISGRRLTYQQCLGFIDKYKAESEDNND